MKVIVLSLLSDRVSLSLPHAKVLPWHLFQVVFETAVSELEYQLWDVTEQVKFEKKFENSLYLFSLLLSVIIWAFAKNLFKSMLS